MPQLSPPFTKTNQTPTPRNRNRRIAITALIVAVVIAVIGGIIFVKMASTPEPASESPAPAAIQSPEPQASQSTPPEPPLTEEELANAKNVIMLIAQDGQGATLADDRVASVTGVLAQRLDRAALEYSKVAFSGDRLYVIFDDSATSDSVAGAVEVVNGDFRLEIRRVLGVRYGDGATVGDTQSVEGGIYASDRDPMPGFVTEYTLGPVEFQGATIAQVSASAFDGGRAGFGEWGVQIQFDAEGARAFSALTLELIDAVPPGNQIALVLDGVVLTAPRILGVITDGDVQIAGSFTQAVAESLANELRLASNGLTFTVQSVTTGN